MVILITTVTFYSTSFFPALDPRGSLQLKIEKDIARYVNETYIVKISIKCTCKTRTMVVEKPRA